MFVKKSRKSDVHEFFVRSKNCISNFQKDENIKHLRVYTKFDMGNRNVRMTQGFF